MLEHHRLPCVAQQPLHQLTNPSTACAKALTAPPARCHSPRSPLWLFWPQVQLERPAVVQPGSHKLGHHVSAAAPAWPPPGCCVSVPSGFQCCCPALCIAVRQASMSSWREPSPCASPPTAPAVARSMSLGGCCPATCGGSRQRGSLHERCWALPYAIALVGSITGCGPCPPARCVITAKTAAWEQAGLTCNPRPPAGATSTRPAVQPRVRLTSHR